MQKLGSAMPLSLFRAGETVTVCRIVKNVAHGKLLRHNVPALC